MRSQPSLRTLLWFICLASAGGMGTSAKAQDWTDKLTFNGFYTLDLTVTDEDYQVISAGGPRLFEADEPSFNNSLIGAQLRYDFTEKWSATVQGVAFLDQNDSLDFDLDWAYISHQFDHDWQVRAGQFQIPFLQGTELRNVGFTRLWARPLTPGSGAGGYDHYSGLEVIKKFSRGDHSWSLQWGAGQAEHLLEDQVDNEDMTLFAAQWDRENFWLRGALLHANYTVTTPRGQLIENAGNVLMGSLESEWRPQNWVLNVGYSTTKSDTTPDDTMAYASLGVELGDFTPYLMSIYRNQNFPTVVIPGGPPGGGPGGGPGMGPPPPPMGDNDRYVQAVGVRWNFKPNMIFKFQLEQNKVDDQSRLQQGRRIEQSRVLSVIMEGVF